MTYDYDNSVQKDIPESALISGSMLIFWIGMICPFHDDHKPSCGINLAKQVYNCFACGAGGNALDFVANMEDLDRGRC